MTLIHLASLWEGSGSKGLLGGLKGLADGAGEAPKSLYDSLPDPMKPDFVALGATVALVVVMMVLLRGVLFRPLLAVLDQRERDINAGSDTKAKAAALVERRQGEYGAKLKELRAQAFAHRKALAEAASKEKQSLVDAARTRAGERRAEALAALRSQKDAAKGELMAQVDALSESMVSHLLKQA